MKTRIVRLMVIPALASLVLFAPGQASAAQKTAAPATTVSSPYHVVLHCDTASMNLEMLVM